MGSLEVGPTSQTLHVNSLRKTACGIIERGVGGVAKLKQLLGEYHGDTGLYQGGHRGIPWAVPGVTGGIPLDPRQDG